MLCGKHSFCVTNLLRHRSGLFLAGKGKLKLMRMLIMQTLGCLQVSSLSRKQMSALWFLWAQWKQDTGGWVSLLALLEDCNYVWQGTLRLSGSLEDLAVWNGLMYVCETDLADFAFYDMNTPLTLVTSLTFFIFRRAAVQKDIVVFCIHSIFYYFCITFASFTDAGTGCSICDVLIV